MSSALPPTADVGLARAKALRGLTGLEPSNLNDLGRRRLGRGALILTLIASADGEWVAITPDGFFDASSNGAKLLHVVIGVETVSIDQVFQKARSRHYSVCRRRDLRKRMSAARKRCLDVFRSKMRSGCRHPAPLRTIRR
jgi:hypothetical protein